MIDNLFDVTPGNVHMVKVDQFEASTLVVPTETVVRATEKQLNFLKQLFAERRNNEEAMTIRANLLSEYKAGKLSVKMASEAINDILSIPKDQQKLSSLLDINHGEVWVTKSGEFVRIKQNQSGRGLYGMKWSWTVEKWEYIPGILSQLDHKITAEEAAAWGHEHQWCVFCSRPLSDPRSEAVGYGERCSENQGLPWG